MNTITASELSSDTGTLREFQWIDVRSPGEYAAGHIPGAVNIPMEQIEARLDDLLPGVPIILVCQAGKRARMVAGLIERCRSDVTVLDGGTAAWHAARRPLVASVKSRFSLERQVRLIAGLIVLSGVVLSVIVQHNLIYLAAAVGVGLTFAGLTDICMLAGLLSRMPWNKARTTPRRTEGARPQSCQL